jgi:hypothetical protein
MAASALGVTPGAAVVAGIGIERVVRASSMALIVLICDPDFVA